MTIYRHSSCKQLLYMAGEAAMQLRSEGVIIGPLISILLAAVILVAPAQGSDRQMLDQAVAGAARTLAAALPGLDEVEFGIPIASYDRAVRRQVVRFEGTTRNVPVNFKILGAGEGSCYRFAAYVAGPGANIYLCPQFFSPGADDLRETTILHEMVHVVGGQGECLAMALTAKIQMRGTGRFQPVDRYWATNHCERSPYQLPQ